MTPQAGGTVQEHKAGDKAVLYLQVAKSSPIAQCYDPGYRVLMPNDMTPQAGIQSTNAQ